MRTPCLWLALALAACTPRQPESPEPAPVDVAPIHTPEPAPKPEPSAADLTLARFRELVQSDDRLPEDVALDGGRKPAELLAIAGIEPGMRVAELATGGGYTAELLARAVGEKGVVFGHNTPFILERFAEAPWSARLERTVMKNVHRVDRPFEDPLPAEATDLDAVFVVLFYHDLFWMDADPDAMNRAVFRALKPGGLYVIVDHAAADGAGTDVVQSLHRIEEKRVRADLEKAGFVFDRQGDFLRNPNDPRDWNAAPAASGAMRGTSDRFVLVYRKP